MTTEERTVRAQQVFKQIILPLSGNILIFAAKARLLLNLESRRDT